MRLILLGLVGLVAGQLSGCGKACTLIGCEDYFEVKFSEDSTWWQGGHRVILDTDIGSVSCEWDPYFPDRNGECTGALSGVTTIDMHGIRLRRTPKQVRLQIDSELEKRDYRGSVFNESYKPDYKDFKPNGPGCGACDQASVTLTFEGDGGPAVEPRRERLDWSMDVVTGGAGGQGGYWLPEQRGIGQACVENVHCPGAQHCSEVLLGWSSSCTQGCKSESECPSGTVCAADLMTDSFDSVSGYCQRPCEDDDDCLDYGSICAANNGQQYCY